MNCYMFNFSKRKNSTKQPNMSTGANIPVELKDDCGVMNPVLLFNPANASFLTPFSPAQFNYVYIPFFNRYYFVTDWTYRLGLWECSLSVDVLASFKSAIGLTSAYIVRSASASDGTIPDGKYPANTDFTIESVMLSSVFYNVTPSEGCYVVGIINNVVSGNIGSICYYVLTSSQLGSLLQFLFSDTIFNDSSISEIGEGLFKSMFNPFQYIVSAMWFPFSLNSIASSTTAHIIVGYWDSNINAQVMGPIAQKTFIQGYIPNHPQISRGSYLNFAPYSRYTLFAEPFGEIPIDSDFRRIGNYLYSSVLVDHITGTALLRVAITENAQLPMEERYITERTAKIGVPIQLAQVATDYIGTLQSAAGAVGSLLSLDFVGAASSVMSAIQSQMPKVSTMGTNGSFALTIAPCTLICQFSEIALENNTEFGRPLCATRTINTLSGFIQTGESDHAFSSFSGENDMINSYLSGGFFYE